MQRPFLDAYAGKRVLVTGHTGFKGSWLCAWLRQLGAEVVGYALDPPSTPNLYHACQLETGLVNVRADIRDFSALGAVFAQARPQVVFHLAAQALVRSSYDDPKGTFDTNAGGTVNVLEAARQTGFDGAIIIVTSDKCYENREWPWGYRENDRLGGRDPYSASKACAEIISAAFARSFFDNAERSAVATCRAGNVIGGGDWGRDRLVPDCVRSLAAGTPVAVRRPQATRPWQHVLDCLSGYLWLGALLARHPRAAAGAWNFGPDDGSVRTVAEVVETLVRHWGGGSWRSAAGAQEVMPHEARHLSLYCDQANARLRWRPAWDFQTTVHKTVEWYRAFYEDGQGIYERTVAQIEEYTRDAAGRDLAWAVSHDPFEATKGAGHD